ncbi:MAG: hypothetical protein B7Z55_16170 [Planctomycetales bacterium 12-60-4]|nr:MAG: hypothetical protein B7Z55_16170 [Planctomycetales bacterium 12-60-4]
MELERAPLSEFRAAMEHHRAAAGIDPQHRFWLGGTNPTCDALATLAAVLRALSWSDVALSVQLSDVRTSKNLSTAA